MLQGSDPFDEFRMKREIQRIETDFRSNAEVKRKRLKELLEEDDGQDPGGVEQKVQEEMESFFRESAASAEEMFSEVGNIGEGGLNEIQERIDEVLRPVETLPRPAPQTPTSADDPACDDADSEIEAALARLRGDEADEDATGESPVGTPDWLDVTEETIDDDDTAADPSLEPVEVRRERLLGAFDESLGRFKNLIREGARSAIVELESEGHDVPLARRAEAGGFSDAVPEAPIEDAPRNDAGEVAALLRRIEDLEAEVESLRDAMVRHGMLLAETA